MSQLSVGPGRAETAEELATRDNAHPTDTVRTCRAVANWWRSGLLGEAEIAELLTPLNLDELAYVLNLYQRPLPSFIYARLVKEYSLWLTRDVQHPHPDGRHDGGQREGCSSPVEETPPRGERRPPSELRQPKRRRWARGAAAIIVERE